MYMAAAVAQSVRAFAPQMEGWMFEYYSCTIGTTDPSR